MSFSDDIREFQRKTNLSMDVIVRKVVIDMTVALTRMSPVDTGRFRGNWMLGVGSPNTSTIEAVDKDGSTTVARITQGVEGVNAGGVVYITNSLPYARRLEYGWSKQAPSPPGIVRLTVQRYTDYIAAAVRSLK
jgi:hypothetical protein